MRYCDHDDDGHHRCHADDHEDKDDDADDHNGNDNYNNHDDYRDWAYLSSLLAPSRLPLPYSTFHFILLAGMTSILIIILVGIIIITMVEIIIIRP